VMILSSPREARAVTSSSRATVGAEAPLSPRPSGRLALSDKSEPFMSGCRCLTTGPEPVAVTHTFVAKSKEDAAAWVTAFNRLIERHTTRRSQVTSPTRHRRVLTALKGTERFGHLRLKKDKKRYFVYLRKGRLVWFRTASVSQSSLTQRELSLPL
jgi:hypothetical protein